MLSLIITLIVVGVLLWAVNTYIPMAPPVKNILNIVVVIAVVLYALSFFGVLSDVNSVGTFNGRTNSGCNMRR